MPQNHNCNFRKCMSPRYLKVRACGYNINNEHTTYEYPYAHTHARIRMQVYSVDSGETSDIKRKQHTRMHTHNTHILCRGKSSVSGEVSDASRLTFTTRLRACKEHTTRTHNTYTHAHKRTHTHTRPQTHKHMHENTYRQALSFRRGIRLQQLDLHHNVACVRILVFRHVDRFGVQICQEKKGQACQKVCHMTPQPHMHRACLCWISHSMCAVAVTYATALMYVLILIGLHRLLTYAIHGNRYSCNWYMGWISRMMRVAPAVNGFTCKRDGSTRLASLLTSSACVGKLIFLRWMQVSLFFIICDRTLSESLFGNNEQVVECAVAEPGSSLPPERSFLGYDVIVCVCVCVCVVCMSVK